MADSTSSTPSAPSSPSAPSTLGVSAAGQAQSAQIHQAQAKSAGKAPNTAPATTSAPQAVATEAKAVIADPSASKTQKQEAKKTLKQLSIKVDGQEFVENLPFEIPDTKEAREFMARELQMSRMGQKRAAHAATLEKEVGQLIKDIKENPFKVLQDPAIKVDVKEAIKKYIEQEIENSNKSPEQLALEAAKEELRVLKEKQELDTKSRDEQERQALADKYAEEYDVQITQALESNKIPKSQAAVKKILAYAELAVAANKDVSINDILPFVADELVNDYRAHLAALPDDKLEEFLTKDVVERLRKTAVRKAKQSQSNPALKAPTKAPMTGKVEEKPKEDKKVSYKQFFKPW